jgi:hypothetical protein
MKFAVGLKDIEEVLAELGFRKPLVDDLRYSKGKCPRDCEDSLQQ